MSAHTARPALLATSMILGPLGIVAGHALAVPADEPPQAYVADLLAHPASSITGGLLTAGGALLLIPATVGLLQLVRGRGARMATIGGVLTGIGAAALGVGTAMITLVIGGLATTDPTLATRVFDAAGDNPVTGAPFLLVPAFFLGLLLLAAGLLRAHTTPRWQPVLLIIGVLAAYVGPSGGLLGALAHLPLGVAIAALGWTLANQTSVAHALPASASSVPASTR